TFRQARALEAELRTSSLQLPVYVGMRNWTPYLHETIARMAMDGVRQAIGIIMSPQQSDAGWGRYQRDVAAACAQVGANAPQIDYGSEWHAHPLFIEAMSAQVADALEGFPSERRAVVPLVFTAHSVPTAMAAASSYVEQIIEAASLVTARLRHTPWSVAYQSRSGNPSEPWLEPDIGDVVRKLARDGGRNLAVAPIGFVCDHVEVLYDLDIAARHVAEEL